MPEASTTPDLFELTRDVTGVANRHDLGPRVVQGMIEMEFRNRDAALDWMRDWIETIDPRGQIEAIRQVKDQVLAIVNFAATGAASGVDTSLRSGQVYSFRDGRINAHDAYYTVDEALNAVGLAE